MGNIQINNGWKDKAHLELLKNAVNSLSELNVLSNEEAENIKLEIKKQDDGKIHTS